MSGDVERLWRGRPVEVDPSNPRGDTLFVTALALGALIAIAVLALFGVFDPSPVASGVATVAAKACGA